MFLLLLVTLPINAQSRGDEARVMEAALNYHFDVSLMYVKHWVVASTTERLEPAAPGTPQGAWSDRAREDYLSRNSTSVETADLELVDHAIVYDLSRFGNGDKFDWKAFVKDYPGGQTWTARVARPGFLDDSHAVVRIDVDNGVTPGILSSVLHLERLDEGWRVVGGYSPAYRPMKRSGQ